LGNPLRAPTTAHTSSADSPLHFSRMESGTLGRPSSKRSNGFFAVYLTIWSFVNVKTCASSGTSTKRRPANANRKFFMRCNVSLFRQSCHAGEFDARQKFERSAAAGGDVRNFI